MPNSILSHTQIRTAFLDFFQSKNHQIVPSAPIVIKNDPSLLFTNAGMNQFKAEFLGEKQPSSKRIADTQKCLRVSGKHNDLEEVGVDTYHHTMFEMLGNWSFGDYFKKEAIEWSWQLLTEIYHLDKSRLYVTVFGGDKKDNLPKDEAAYDEWKKWTTADRILWGSKKDNFWEMGETGPCGPCSEIHVDMRPNEERKAVNGADLVNKDNPQVIEVWNNVFMEFNRSKDGKLHPLPAKSVDTGMGFERLVRVIQGKNSNYDTDIFIPLIQQIENITQLKYDYSDSKQAVAFRVLADHIRAIAFTIADGQLPSNTGAGYVIRRILRRAVRYYYSYLNYKQPLLYQLLPNLADTFQAIFPNLAAQQDFVQKVIKEEEEAFLRTLERGLKLMEEIARTTQQNKQKIIDGKACFELFDTFGFPIDLTRLIANENQLEIDEKGFETALQEQKQRSRAATAIDAQDWTIINENLTPNFVGYDQLETQTPIIKYRKVEQKGKTIYQWVLAQNPFYAESGGQVGDTGALIFGEEKMEVIDTKKEHNTFFVFTEKLPTQITAQVTAKVDATKRKAIALHHTATHLLHAALRKVLGKHVEQKGSLVNDQNLRFDFAHFSKLSDEEILLVEQIINEKIRANIPVVVQEMDKAAALALGAMALFGEKYGDKVRVVMMDPSYSVELCGGTHVGNTGELGIVKIKSETAIAAGVRRIEALSGKAAENHIQQAFQQLQDIKTKFNQPQDLNKMVDATLTENKTLKKQKESLENKLLQQEAQQLLAEKQVANGRSFIAKKIATPSLDNLKKLANLLRAEADIVLLSSLVENNILVAIGLNTDYQTKTGLNATTCIKTQIAPLINGGGGGSKDLATAVGKNMQSFAELFDLVQGW